MSEHLIIRNFGPIESAEMDINGLTVFVGAQATGKSLAAQLLYFMRQVENLAVWRSVNRSPHSDSITDELKQLLSWWIGNNAANYFRKDTFVAWREEKNAAETECSIEGNFQPNPRLAVRMQDAARNSWEKQKAALPMMFHDIYIPAGRSLYSFLPPSRVLRIVSASPEDWPGYIYVFYEILGESINRLFAGERDEGGGAWTGDAIFSESAAIISEYIRSRMDEILKGKLHYSQSGAVVFEVDQKMFFPTAIASGQMEVWPFLTILLAHLSRLDRARRGPLRIYFEEPEAHLHPAAQKKLLEIIIAADREQYILTTHSPYVLYTINNSLMKGKLLASRQKELELVGDPAVLKETLASLRASQVSAYLFGTDGQVTDIFDPITGLVDEYELDQVAENLGADFTAMQESLLS